MVSREQERRNTRKPSRNVPVRNRKERMLLGRMVICTGIFVLLVAGKILLPAPMQRLDTRLSALLQQNMDVEEVFSAVGEAVSGAQDLEDTLDQVCQAMLRPGEGNEAVKVSGTLDPASASRKSVTAPQAEKPAEQSAPEPSAKEKGTEALSYLSYSQKNLPETVSLEQELLGFEYCTPVQGTLTSGFGYRTHPMTGEDRFHYGIDIGAETGTEILSFADGTVGAVGESNSYGKYLIVNHPGGYATLYAHCSRITTVSGASVKRGEPIAEVGETGMATGPHLHLELHRNNRYLNPIYYVTLR